MPLINVGQSCSPLAAPSGPTGPLYATTTVTGTPATSYVVGLKTYSGGAYVYAGSTLTVGNLTNGNEAKLYFTWDASISVNDNMIKAMGITSPTQPLIVGDSRLRYVTSAAESAPKITMIAYFPDPTDLANCKFINFTNLADLPTGAIDTKLGGTTTPTYTLTSTPPTSNPSVPQRYFFLDKSYVAGGPKRYLGQDGNPYDVNQALANLSYIIPFTVTSTLTAATGAQNTITDYNLAGSARSSAVPSTSPVFTPTAGWVTINSVQYIATTILSQDQETIDATALSNELDYIILSCIPSGGTSAQVLGYTSSYGTTLKSSYFAYGVTKYNYGYFIMVPLTTESTGSSSFMLLTGDGAKYLTLTSTTLSYNDVPAGMLSTLSGSTSPPYKFLAANYGAWTFETSGTGFKAKYTPPYSSTAASSTVASAVVVSSTSADTSTKAGVTSPSASVYLRVTTTAAAISANGDTAANGTVFTCTYCSPSNGMCMPGAGAFHGSPVAGPAVGTYTGTLQNLVISTGNMISQTAGGDASGFSATQFTVTSSGTATFSLPGSSSQTFTFAGNVITYGGSTFTKA